MAPDFAEVEENVEYIEKEDEFDIHPFEEIHKRRLDLEDEEVDALTVEPTKGYCEEEGFRMPVLMEIDDSESEEEVVAVGPGEWRVAKSKGEGKEASGMDTAISGDERSSKRPNNGTKVASKPRRR